MPTVGGSNAKWGTWWAKVAPEPCLSNIASGNWNTAGTWGCGGVPAANKNVSIVSGHNVTLDVDPLAASITVNAGGTLTVSTTRTLSCKLIVYGNLNMTGGKLNLGSNNIFLAEGATLTVSPATSHFVTNGTGTVSKIITGGSSFEFPVSPTTGSYNALTIATAGGNPAEVFSVRVSAGVTPASSNNAACVQRTWNINEMTTGGNSATLTFKWAAAEHGASFSGSSAFAFRHNGSTYTLASSM
ncbi:MAG: G8 domain-containing protein, partial [Chitinophagaceae bacterium]|nr:G8 domain-containing protein [Chitinophagaceae bacterium]